jgi:hypothetical protein
MHPTKIKLVARLWRIMHLPFPPPSVDNFHAVYMVVNMFIHRHKYVVSTEIEFSLFIVIVRFSNMKLIQILLNVLDQWLNL